MSVKCHRYQKGKKTQTLKAILACCSPSPTSPPSQNCHYLLAQICVHVKIWSKDVE